MLQAQGQTSDAEEMTKITTRSGRSLPAHKSPHAAPISKLPPATVLPNAALALSKPSTTAPISVTTYHYDSYRTGWNSKETVLTPSNVASGSFGLLTTLAVDGTVLAQPLLVAGFLMPNGQTHDVLLVATENDSLYAYDANNYSLLWQVNFGTPQLSGDIGCADVPVTYGISSTPVIVRSSASAATIYLIANTEPESMTFQSQIHAIDLGTGADLIPPVELTASATLSNGGTMTFNGQDQWSRTGLAWSNNSLYVGIGSHCDNGSSSISGWMLRYDASLTQKAAFHTIDDPHALELASIWMGGYASAFDEDGNIFFVTGNGSFDAVTGGANYGESVMSMSPDLSTVKSFFTPTNELKLNQNDGDFGSGGVMLIPTSPGKTPLAVAMGKDPILYLLDRDHLGGISGGNSGALQATRVSAGAGVWGGPAYYGGSSLLPGALIYYQTDSDVLHSYHVSSNGSPSLLPAASGTSTGGYGGATPVVSSNGTKPNTAIVWLVRRSSPLALEAYDAIKLGAPIYSATAGTWANPSINAFIAPLEANGRVYVGAQGTVSVYGMAPSSP